jgi:hypothetical protein
MRATAEPSAEVVKVNAAHPPRSPMTRLTPPTHFQDMRFWRRWAQAGQYQRLHGANPQPVGASKHPRTPRPHPVNALYSLCIPWRWKQATRVFHLTPTLVGERRNVVVGRSAARGGDFVPLGSPLNRS